MWVVLVLALLVLPGQSTVLRGTVRDASTLLGVPYAQISFVGSDALLYVAFSNPNGSYAITYVRAVTCLVSWWFFLFFFLFLFCSLRRPLLC